MKTKTTFKYLFVASLFSITCLENLNASYCPKKNGHYIGTMGSVICNDCGGKIVRGMPSHGGYCRPKQTVQPNAAQPKVGKITPVAKKLTPAQRAAKQAARKIVKK